MKRSFKLPQLLKERGLDLQEGTLSIRQQHKLLTNNTSLKSWYLRDYAFLDATALGKARLLRSPYLTDAERLKKYETNTLGDETAKFNKSCWNICSAHHTLGMETTWDQKSKAKFSFQLYKNALKTRKEAGFLNTKHTRP